MSLTTGFPFHAFVGDLKTRKVLEEKNAVSLSLLSSEDMSRMSFVEVRTRCGHEEKLTPWLPIRRRGELLATFYDTRMGNFDARGFPRRAAPPAPTHYPVALVTNGAPVTLASLVCPVATRPIRGAMVRWVAAAASVFM